jgi:hypothetical protein
MADRMGAIKIVLAQLEREQAEIKQQFIDHGLAQYDGQDYRVTLTETVRHTLDMKAVRAKLSKAWQEAHTNTTHVIQMHVLNLGDMPNVVRLPK